MAHIVGYPRMGPKKELKFALESCWDGKSTGEELKQVAKDFRALICNQQKEARVIWIPSNTFRYMTTSWIPLRSCARAVWMDGIARRVRHVLLYGVWKQDHPCHGNDQVVRHQLLGTKTVPVFVGPVSYMLLAKATRNAPKGFDPLSLLDSLLPVYKEILAELKAVGIHSVQFDEPTHILDLESSKYEACKKAYDFLGADFGPGILIATYFTDLPAEAYKTPIGSETVSHRSRPCTWN